MEGQDHSGRKRFIIICAGFCGGQRDVPTNAAIRNQDRANSENIYEVRNLIVGI